VKITVKAPCAGSIWLQTATVGQQVTVSDVLVILECMKLEIPVEAPQAGSVVWLADASTVVAQDDVVAIIETVP
jgi:acetyl-CoA carboxylase biotin carboxyl carrier protein